MSLRGVANWASHDVVYWESLDDKDKGRKHISKPYYEPTTRNTCIYCTPIESGKGKQTVLRIVFNDIDIYVSNDRTPKVIVHKCAFNSWLSLSWLTSRLSPIAPASWKMNERRRYCRPHGGGERRERGPLGAADDNVRRPPIWSSRMERRRSWCSSWHATSHTEPRGRAMRIGDVAAS